MKKNKIELNRDEWTCTIRALNAMRNSYIAEGRYTDVILLNAINAHCLAVFLPQSFVNSSSCAFAHTSSSFPRLATKILASSVRVYDVKEYIDEIILKIDRAPIKRVKVKAAYAQ